MKILENGKGLFVGLERIDAEVLDLYPNLEIIGANITGTDLINTNELEQRGIKLITLNDFPYFKTLITSTAEHTIGLMIALMRDYKTSLNAPYKDRDSYTGYKLDGKSLGIIGYGRVGKQVEKMAKGLGMKVKTYDKFLNYWKERDFKEVLGCDVVSLHVPLQNNNGFFGLIEFNQMKPTSYLINTSRNDVIDNGSLLFALKNNIILGAAIDFIDDKELLAYAATNDNLILTNHQGGNTYEDRELTEDFIIKQITNAI